MIPSEVLMHSYDAWFTDYPATHEKAKRDQALCDLCDGHGQVRHGEGALDVRDGVSEWVRFTRMGSGEQLMTYIVTTKPPCDCQRGKRTPLNCWDCTSNHPSRRAVATLDEARDYAHQHGATFSVASISERGGTVGPLPDGTTIKVEREAECRK
jgi:hypothetical protein